MLALSRAPSLSVFRFMVVTGLVALPQAGASFDDPGKTSKAASSVAAAMISGRVTDEAGAPLADVRVSVVAVGDPETRTVNAIAQSKKLVARSDATGGYRLEVPGITKRTLILIDAVKPGYRSLMGPLLARGDTKRFRSCRACMRKPLSGTFYVTSDLLFCEHQPKNSLGRYELAICLPGEHEWAQHILFKLSHATLEEVFDVGHTLDIAAWVEDTCAIKGLLITQLISFQFSEQPFGALLCIGVTCAELNYALEHGSRKLLGLLETKTNFPCTDLSRASVV